MSTLELEQYRIAGGNQTALVRGARTEDHPKLARELLQSKTEQVGFVTESATDEPQLLMMGDELCINAVLALATDLGGSGFIDVNSQSISYIVDNSQTGIEVSLSYELYQSASFQTVIFDDIGYAVATEKMPVNDPMIKEWCVEYGLPAFGSIQLSGTRIEPRVYVRQTDTIIDETACGSGSIAAYICLAGANSTKTIPIIQPAGQTITVRRHGGEDLTLFSVSAAVERIS